ncbi:MAG: superoxide dismutase family protein [Bdellovibrionales bacterium]|nr:superoxide dismutase family protein [Bdellovibrionales bacterium]
MHKLIAKYSILVFGILLINACHKQHEASSMSEADANSVSPVIGVTIEAKSGSDIQGELTLTQIGDKQVLVKGIISGLAPNSKHGFHVHEKGDCTADDASSAGGHFNPTGSKHGALNETQSHAGDLGNITADKNGEANIDITKSGVTLDDQDISFLGRAIVVHEKADDLSSQPSGDAGKRIGCGVIEKP